MIPYDTIKREKRMAIFCVQTGKGEVSQAVAETSPLQSIHRYYERLRNLALRSVRYYCCMYLLRIQPLM